MDGQDATADRPGPSSLGERIRAVRRSWQWSQEELARLLKVDQASVSFWERDKVKPSGSALISLASLFRVEVPALEDGLAFRLPEAPSDLEAAKADRQYPRSVCLPMVAGHAVTVVDLRDGTSAGQDLPEALMSLSHGLGGHRRAWLVLD